MADVEEVNQGLSGQITSKFGLSIGIVNASDLLKIDRNGDSQLPTC